MEREQRPNTPRSGRTLAVCALGYGLVCGLKFPLMISSTFLQEMSLSHGAGDAFGALFFIVYALTMALTALTYAMRRKPTRGRRMIVALGAVFLGNALMLARLVGLIQGAWLYAVIASGLIGYGLATAELAWMSRITALHESGAVSLSRVVPLAFLCGGAAAAVIFALSGPFELAFALSAVVVSALLFVDRAAPVERAGRVSLARESRGDFAKAVTYLAVFSFVFGVVSQVATTVEVEPLPIAAQGVLGIVLAAGVMLTYAVRRKRALSVGDLYDILFPIVAVSLIALPFITSPLVHVTATVLVFVSFYLSGMNVRIAVCLLAERERMSPWVYLSIALAASAVLILAGVALGAVVIASGVSVASLALISLVSLFVLALDPIVTKRLERKRESESSSAAEASGAARGQISAGEAADMRTMQADLLRSFAEEHRLTIREAEVLALLAQGRTRTYIADELGLSPNTVKGYIRNVYQKSGAVDKQDLLDRVELYLHRS